MDWTIRDFYFDSRLEKEIFPLSTASRPALDSIHPPIQWVPENIFPWLMWPRHEAEQVDSSRAEMKKL
jgi:hypothetical protein